MNDGIAIPQLGFGVFKIDPAETAAAVGVAFEIGYRHIDTAEQYRNEPGGGRASPQGGDRTELFITSKVTNGAHETDVARRAFDGTLSALGFEYIDLFLIHWPLPTAYGGDFVSIWSTLIDLERDGGVRSIGVSNFQIYHLERLLPRPTSSPRSIRSRCTRTSPRSGPRSTLSTRS